MRRRLVLKRETLAELLPDDLAHVAGAAPPTPPCDTWGCVYVEVTQQTCAVTCLGCTPTVQACLTDKCL